MLTELQTSYDKLLHKFAAAENALDKVDTPLYQSLTSHLEVRFGAAPPSGGGELGQVVSMTESVAGKLALMAAEERRQGEAFRVWLGGLQRGGRGEGAQQQAEVRRPEIRWI